MNECNRGHQNGFEKLQEKINSEDSSGYSSASAVFADSPSFEDEESSHGDISSRLVEHMKHQFGEIKNVWSKNVDGLKRAINTLKVPGYADRHRLDKDREMFDIVLCIFNGPLEAASETTHLLEELHMLYPDEAEFLIPQLAASLLYGPQESVDLLHGALLRICSKSNTFAHRLYYFITSFALSEAGVDPHGVWIIKRLLADIAKEGEIPCKYLALDESSINEQYSIPVMNSANTNAYANAADPKPYDLIRLGEVIDQSLLGKIVPDVSDSMCSSMTVVANGPAPHQNFHDAYKVEIDEEKATCEARNTKSFPGSQPCLVSSITSPVFIPKTSLQQQCDNIICLDKPSKSNSNMEHSEIKQVYQPISETEQSADPLLSVIKFDGANREGGHQQSKELSVDKELFMRNGNASVLECHDNLIRRYPIPLLHQKTVNTLKKYQKNDMGGVDSTKFEEDIQNIDWWERKEDKRESSDKRGNKRGKQRDLELIRKDNCYLIDSKLSEQCVPMDNHFASSIRFWEKMINISRVLGSIPRFNYYNCIGR